jgi:carbon storage regulator CsrA
MSLILRRSAGQSIVIGEMGEIEITLYRIVNGVAQIGIKAPKAVRVERLERLEKNQAKQAQVNPTDTE